MVGSAIRRTRPMLARYDVSPHMVKWWKSQLKDDGQVRWALRDQRRNMAKEMASDGRTLSLIGAWRRESTDFYLHDQRIYPEGTGVGGRKGWPKECSDGSRPQALICSAMLLFHAWAYTALFQRIMCIFLSHISLFSSSPSRRLDSADLDSLADGLAHVCGDVFAIAALWI